MKYFKKKGNKIMAALITLVMMFAFIQLPMKAETRAVKTFKASELKIGDFIDIDDIITNDYTPNLSIYWKKAAEQSTLDYINSKGSYTVAWPTSPSRSGDRYIVIKNELVGTGNYLLMLEIHTHFDTWNGDETNHWFSCYFDDTPKTQIGVHTYSEWVIDKEPTDTMKGSKSRSCSICKRRETVDIPALAKPQEPETTHQEVNANGAPQTGDASNRNIYLLLLITTSGMFVLNKRRKMMK